MIKSERHSKIAGDFGEHMILYWLSKNGFETLHIDHVGIDIIAAKGNNRWGISVKSRSRQAGTEYSSVNIADKNDMTKISRACRTFGCKPYVAVVVDCPDEARKKMNVFILPISILARQMKIKKMLTLSMRAESIESLKRYSRVGWISAEYTSGGFLKS